MKRIIYISFEFFLRNFSPTYVISSTFAASYGKPLRFQKGIR